MTVGIVTGLAAEARLAEGLGIVAAGGGTQGGAALAAARLLGRGATCLVSFGLAGGLDPSLRAGAIVVPRAVLAGGERFAADPRLIAAMGGATHELLVGGATVLVSAAGKLVLGRSSGAVAIDLESGAVARVADAADVPFAVLRAICDPADRDLPPATLLALDGAGAVGVGRVLRSLAGRPGQLPALLLLTRDAARARAALIRRVGDIRRGGGLVG